MKTNEDRAGGESKGRILVVDDQPSFRRLLVRILADDGYEVEAAGDGRRALEMARLAPFHVVLTDVSMPAMDGMTLLQKLQAEMPETVVVLVTAFGTVPAAVEAMRLGAFDYLMKPLGEPQDVCVVAARAMTHRETLLATSATAPSEEAELLYESEAMARVVEAVRRVARTDATVLVTGESGTGKEVVARLVHLHSPRAHRPYVAVNCAALAESLLDSELFGHERGAFTGADRRREGRFETADGGTLFLDEVGEMSPAVQVKLLRVLQERSFERVGGSATIEVDVRLVAATNSDLEADIAAGRFRRDLFYRLNVVPLQLPPLRDRDRDAVALARHFLVRLGSRHGRGHLDLAAAAEAAILAYPWPGNVRELLNVIERAVVLCRGDEIAAEDLLLGVGPVQDRTDLPLNLRELEKDAIERALAKVGGNRRRAADLLGIGLRTLQYKLNEYDLR